MQLRSSRVLMTLLGAGAALILLLATNSLAQTPQVFTRAEVEQWLNKYRDARPDFKPGDVISGGDIEKLRPFVPPGYFEQMKFPEMRVEVIAPRNHTPRRDYMACTEKYQTQVKLNSDGTLSNYVCGQPFANSALRVEDPQSGFRAVHNFDYRWQNFGQVVMNCLYVWERFGGSHAGEIPAVESPPENWTAGIAFTTRMPKDTSELFGGGGVFERSASGFYQRMYFSHLAQLADQGGLFGVPDAKTFLWKEFNGLFSPFDMRGTVVIDYRYADPNRADDAWAYDPKLRRVRRISVEVKADSVAGTEQNYEDFYTFAGRSTRWNFKFLGWKDVLCVHDSKHDYSHTYGPNGFIPSDAWSVRRFAVIERIPKEPRHPYSSAVMFWDAENWHPWMMLAFDRDLKLRKISIFQMRWTEDFKAWAEINHGVESNAPIGVHVLDLEKERATVFTNLGAGFPTAAVDRVQRLFDISKLEEEHR